MGEERLFAKVMHLAKELKPLMSKMRPSTKFEGASKGVEIFGKATCVEGWSQKACSKVDGWSDSDIAFEDGEDTD